MKDSPRSQNLAAAKFFASKNCARHPHAVSCRIGDATLPQHDSHFECLGRTMQRTRVASYFFAFSSLAFLTFAAPRAHGSAFPGSSWIVLSPETLGLDSSKLEELRDLVDGSGMIVRYGCQVFTWGDISVRRDWASASKPVVSTFLMMAAYQGLCTYQSTMGTYHSGGSTKDRNIKFVHLANQLSGYSRGENPAAAWAYNDHAMNLYGYTLFHKVFGAAPNDVFEDHFGFFQFQDSPSVSNSQYGRLTNVSIRDFARIGLFWLERGNWKGIQRIPAYYFNVLDNPVPPSQPLSTLDGPESWDFGTFGGDDYQTDDGPGEYAFNFWVNTHGFIPGVPTDVFQAVGHGGQEICTVIPSLHLVAVGTGNWDHPSTEAIQLLLEAASSAVSAEDGIQHSTWGRLKDRYRSP
jgi:CubicO group peptidase (beta-lactamase class C family)